MSAIVRKLWRTRISTSAAKPACSGLERAGKVCKDEICTQNINNLTKFHNLNQFQTPTTYINRSTNRGMKNILYILLLIFACLPIL